MIWELIATVVAGFGAAGIALLLRKLSAQRLAKYWIPIFAGAGMLFFQIYLEYQWFDHQRSRLPPGVEVVMQVEESQPFRPWTYLIPQTRRFMAADFGKAVRNQQNDDVMLVDVYLFAQKTPVQPVRQLVHCQAGKRADFSAKLVIPGKGQPLDNHWFELPAGNTLLQVCQRI